MGTLAQFCCTRFCVLRSCLRHSGLCIGATCAAGAAAAAELQATHQRHRWRTGAGGVTGCTVAAPVEDWRRHAAAPVGDRSRRTSREPAAGVMDRRRSGQRSDSESRSLHTSVLGQPAGPRHLPAPTGVRRGTSDGHGEIGSKAVEITGRVRQSSQRPEVVPRKIHLN